MISVLQRGVYKLIETISKTKILIFDNKDDYAWINAGKIGEILVISHKKHKAGYILCMGNYRLYSVKGEDDLSDQQHLELSIGPGYWQGYLLPTGLPTDENIKNKIIPTKELITVSNEVINSQAGLSFVQQ